jgi:hypothetical protein
MLARWLDSKNVFFTASFMGVNVGPRIGGIRKAMGCKKGEHDLFIFEPRGKFHGMTLELKVKGGKETPQQIEFMKRATDLGYYSVIMPATMNFQEAYAWAIRELEAYLNLKEAK